MPKENSLLEDNFIEEDENDFSFQDDILDVADKEEGDEGAKQPTKPEDREIEVQVVSDTPARDKGKRVADPEKDGPIEAPSEDELRSYSKDIRKRISDLTEKRHAERRRADEIARQFSELQNFTKGLMKTHNGMADLIDNGEKALIAEHKAKWEAQMAQAKAAYREAHEAGDPNGIIAAQENIAKAAAALQAVAGHNPQPLPRQSEEEFEKRFRPPQVAPKLDEKTQGWIDKNPWFTEDTLMHAYAMGVHNQLTQRGVQPTDDRYFKTIDTEMRRRFPEKFKSEQPRRTVTTVAAAGREGAGKVVQKVTLTESQIKLAAKLGLTPQQYAAEWAKTQR